MKNTLLRISGALALVLAASAAPADPLVPSIDTVADGQNGAAQNFLVGSDTFQQIMNQLIGDLGLTQITQYRGLGSTQGERYLEGSPEGTDPTCTPGDVNGGSPDGNPGCEEIAPMSRRMDSSICEDEQSAGEGPNATAEHLAVCNDTIVVVTDNKAHRQYADNAASCPAGTGADPALPLSDNPPNNNPLYAATGFLRNAGAIGTHTIATWQDVLRIIYTGCTATGAACTEPRLTRCNSAVRQTLVNSWATIFKSDGGSVDCAEGNCCSQLRQAYRRDDSSGTTNVFLGMIGAPTALTARTRMVSPLGACVAPAETHAFCDGGDLESFFPAPSGDPITRACRPEDDLCRANGQSGIVRAVRSPQDLGAAGFPPNQCTKNAFAKVNFLNTNSCAICPDGKFPSGGLCWAPYFAVDRNGDGDITDVGDRDYNCMNASDSRPSDAAVTLDGRAFNYCMRDSITGACQTLSGNVNVFEVASWRQNMAPLRTGLTYPGGPYLTSATVSCPVSGGGSAVRQYPNGIVCRDGSATELISCLVANTHCTCCWGGRGIAVLEPYDDLHEPVRVNGIQGDSLGYPMSRELFISAIGGFENITIDCLNRGGSAALCADQVTIAQSFFDMDADAVAACEDNGFLALPTGSRCVGTQSATVTCGRAEVQAKGECQPQ